MKKLLIRMAVIALFAVQLVCAGSIDAQAKAKKTTKAKYRNQFVKGADGSTYFYNGKGKKLKKQFFTTRTGNTYYFNYKGKRVSGWIKIGEEYYFFSKGGVMQKNREIDGIKIKKNGTIKKNEYNIEKIKTIKKAEKIVSEITNKKDSKEVKLKKCFDWVISFPYCQYRKMSQVKDKNWETIFANDIFDNRQGCCVSEGAAFAFLARACGYKETYVCSDTAHGWAEIDGYVYDPLFAEAKDYSKYFKCSYGNYGLSPAGGRVKV